MGSWVYQKISCRLLFLSTGSAAWGIVPEEDAPEKPKSTRARHPFQLLFLKLWKCEGKPDWCWFLGRRRICHRIWGQSGGGDRAQDWDHGIPLIPTVWPRPTPGSLRTSCWEMQKLNADMACHHFQLKNVKKSSPWGKIYGTGLYWE